MNSAVLNAVPSPSEPADLVEDATLNLYYNLYTAASELLKVERDKLRIPELLKIKTFVDDTIKIKEGQDASAGPPAPTPPAVQQAAGAPQAGAVPGAQPGQPAPGLPGAQPQPVAPAAG
jgi:hypothetical protein